MSPHFLLFFLISLTKTMIYIETWFCKEKKDKSNQNISSNKEHNLDKLRSVLGGGGGGLLNLA